MKDKEKKFKIKTGALQGTSTKGKATSSGMKESIVKSWRFGRKTVMNTIEDIWKRQNSTMEIGATTAT